MAQLTIQNLEKQFDSVLTITGQDSYVNWEEFTNSSKNVIAALDALNNQIHVFREAQQKYFLQNMRKLKGLDLPDVIKTVKSKKLPLQALKSILPRFKLNGEAIELVDSVEKLRAEAEQEFKAYLNKNNSISQYLNNTAIFIREKTDQYDFKVQNKIQQVVNKEAESLKLNKYNFPQENLNALVSNIQVQYIQGTQGLIGLKTYSQIVNASVELVFTEFCKLTQDSRKKQRQSMNEPSKYLMLMNDYLVGSETLIGEGQVKIADKIGISFKKFEQSEINLMERGLAQNVLSIQTIARTKLKERLKPTKSVPLEEAKAVLSYQIKMITEKGDFIKEVFAGLSKTPQTTQLIPMLLTIILNDYVFQQFGYEEQDFMQNLSEQVLTTNPELNELFRQMEVVIIKLMQKLELIPENVGQYMQQQNRPQQQQIGNFPPQGMMPGMDPMALLQYQQMQAQMQMMQGMNKK